MRLIITYILLFSFETTLAQSDMNFLYGTKLDSLSYEKRRIESFFGLKLTIDGNTKFRSCTLVQGVDLESPTFKGKVDFSNSLFLQKADFQKPEFLKSSYFNNSVFYKGANFSGVIFSKTANFSGAQFLDNVDFSDSEFSEIVYLNNAIFPQKLTFNGARFGEVPNFDFAQLPDSLILNNVNLSSIKSNIFFNNMELDSLRKRTGNLNQKCTIFLHHVDFSKIVINFEKFKLGFNESTNYEDRVSQYQQLIKRCQDLGMESSVEGFSIVLQKLKLQQAWGTFAPFFIKFQYYWWNFGFKRSLILRNIIFAFLISFIIFFIGFKKFALVYFPVDQLGLTSKDALILCYNRSLINQINNRFKIVLFYTALIFFGWKMDHSKVNYRAYPWTSILVYLIYVVGLIHIAYLVGFVIDH
ncbi:hypothetical protein Slin_6675 (plasmid) [Spirosoma linguale DSM 74]|uniref:Pentapeptide repeat protein n=2 Tax=Spirosoma TaxID=107 RepID=D2QUZ9_SPILD|nr:hypothetical protein Slin_6675 [Spirosoma linguale DSM 74]